MARQIITSTSIQKQYFQLVWLIKEVRVGRILGKSQMSPYIRAYTKH